MGLARKIEFLFRNPFFPIRLFSLRRKLKKFKSEDKQTWIFQCDFAGHYSYLRPYYEYAEQIGGVEVFFTVGNTQQKSPRSYLLEQGVPPSRILEPIDFVLHSDWDAYVSPTEWGNGFPLNKNALKVQIFHTLADKKMEYGVELLKFDIIFANGPIHHEFLSKYVFNKFEGSKEKCKVCNVGYAKIDNLFDGTLQEKIIRQKLSIADDDLRPIVLYAPNWEASSALRLYGEEVFQKLVQDEYIVLIKLHYMSFLSIDYEYATGGVDWKQVLEKYAVEDNIRVLDSQDINQYFVVSDLLLTDYGGASLEFLSMNKPIVYLDCPQFFEERGKDVFEYKARETGIIIDTIDDIIPAIQKSLVSDALFTEKRKELAQKLLYNPGKAAKIGFNVIMNGVLNRS